MNKSKLSAVIFSLSICLASFFTAELWSQQPASSEQKSAVPTLPADIPANAERYSLLIMGNLAGQQAVWTASDGTLHIFFQFNDRGRGPKTTSILKLDANGVPVSEVITGNDYLKSPVNENYSLAAGLAHWKNDDEQGERKLLLPLTTFRSMAAHPKPLLWHTPLYRMAGRSLCCRRAKRMSSA